jgi:hypothetical protein
MENPEQSTNNPDQSTNNPDQSTNNPEQSTNNPEQSTNNPEQSTNNPDQSTNNPDQSTNNVSLSHSSSSSSISTNSDYDNYVFRAKVCTRLSRELNLPEITYELSDYEPPEAYGLENSNTIIPAYYHLDKHPSRILNVDYLHMIKDDIRNFRQLNEYQIEYIKDLSHEDKNDLLEIFNDSIGAFNELIK